jgi:hypothetical protein
VPVSATKATFVLSAAAIEMRLRPTITTAASFKPSEAMARNSPAR